MGDVGSVSCCYSAAVSVVDGDDASANWAVEMGSGLCCLGLRSPAVACLLLSLLLLWWPLVCCFC